MGDWHTKTIAVSAGKQARLTALAGGAGAPVHGGGERSDARVTEETGRQVRVGVGHLVPSGRTLGTDASGNSGAVRVVGPRLAH